jgi:hypothetical protein
MLDQSRFVIRPAPGSTLGPAEHLKRCVLVGCTTPRGAEDVAPFVEAPKAPKPARKRKAPAKPRR